MKTHQQLVEEWKKELGEFRILRPLYDLTVEQEIAFNQHEKKIASLEDLFTHAMLAAAKGAVEAGRVEQEKVKEADFSNSGDVLEKGSAEGWNAAIFQSAAQIRSYLGEI